MNWSNISLAKFQQIEEVNGRDLQDIDKVLFSLCVLYNRTEDELNNENPKKVIRMMKDLEKVFASPLTPMPSVKVGRYYINYEMSSITFGQYIELTYFLSSDTVKNAHYILATMAKKWLRKHKTSDHRKKAEYFLNQPVAKVIGSMEQIKKNYESFNLRYKRLFGVDKEVSGEVDGDEFIKQYGWIYSATQVAAHEGMTLDQAFALPIIRAFNALAFLKAKGKYEALQFKKMKTTA